ncbi:Anucleate primary sterigmata protein B [Xylographa opegraphella]|nr:Anucleate primary sterigmata protein B [Xylographa opegraphella]
MASSPLRPQRPRQHSKVPGGFDTDDELSPIKIEFDDADLEPNHERDSTITDKADQNHNRVNIWNEDGGVLMPGNDSIVDEKEMARKLMDVESSFMPELSPIGSSGTTSTMDKKRKPEPISSSVIAGGSPAISDPEDDHELPSTPPEFYQTPAPAGEELASYKSSPETSADHANTSSLETMSSSPTAAAAARTVSRVISIASIGGYETAEEESPSKSFGEQNKQSDCQDTTPRNTQVTSRTSSRAGSPTPTKLRSAEDVEEAADGDIDEDEPGSLQDPKRRPKYNTSRYGSQRSSYSSYTSRITTSTEAASDITLGAEYALQTGGAVPFGSSTSSRIQPGLSRSISLGSVASGISALSDGEDRRRPSNNALDGLGSFPEEEQSFLTNQALQSEEVSLPHTPRTASAFSESVSNTVKGHHLRPNEKQSIARGHWNKSNASSPERRIAIPTPATGRGKNLTLKEQSSTIDKLQKENWDLKLKIQFMSNLINQRSEEGVNSIMSENVELRTDKYKAAQEIRKQKRLVRELEFKLREMEESKAARTRDQVMDSEQPKDGATTHELQTEVTFLRERSETYETEIEKLRQEGAIKDGEKRHLAELVKSMSERRAGESDIGVREEVDMWKDLLETETARREQADEDNKQLHEELWRMKADAVSTISYNQPGSGYNTASRHHVSSSTTQVNGYAHDAERNGVTSAVSSTLVEQLRHENDELRREVGAQTSMLTSRNREKERLYQEIEDLKMGQRRRGGSRSVTGDSIFERSASRTHRRSASRTSEATRITQMSDAEREAFETTNGELRDQMSELKLSNQDLVAQMEGLLDELAEFDVTKKDFQKLEQMHEALLEQMEQTTQDILTMQKERDEALELHEDAESNFKDLEDEAQQHISSLRAEIGEKHELLEKLESELASRDEESDTLRNEVRMLSEGLNRVEAEVQTKIRRIQEVELENEDINRELETLEKSLLEVNGKNEKLVVELESRQGECAFLREEQDGCMIKIGDLESAIKATQSNLNSEKDHNNDLEIRLAEERHQREVIGSKEKQEVQKMMNDINRELSSAKDEIRELKKILESCEVDLAAWKGKYMDIESSLRELLGDATGSKSTFLSAISQLQKDLESTSSDLDSARHSLSEKERLLYRRDALLESHGLESKKLSELLEKERAGRRADKVQHEQWQKSHQHTSRTVSQKDTRITELEAARQVDRRKLAAMEQEYKDQLLERNNLLLAVWHRLASICGKDWQHQNSLVSGHLPTVEVVSGMLPGFSKNLISAVKTVEGLMSGFRSRIRGIERDLMKDFQALEHNLDMRIKRLDRLESAVQISRVSGAASAAPEIAKLRGENRMLKAELGVFHKQDMHSRASRPDSKNSSSERGVSGSRGPLPAGLVRHHSSSAVEVRSGEGPETPQAYSQPLEPSQQRWIHRLKELERRLKAEREARLLDRSGARKRLEEERAAAEELRRELEREKVRWGQ